MAEQSASADRRSYNHHTQLIAITIHRLVTYDTIEEFNPLMPTVAIRVQL